MKVLVTEAPESGRANAAVEGLLAKKLGLPGRDVRIVRGLRSRDKVVEVRGVSRTEAMSRLAVG